MTVIKVPAGSLEVVSAGVAKLTIPSGGGPGAAAIVFVIDGGGSAIAADTLSADIVIPWACTITHHANYARGTTPTLTWDILRVAAGTSLTLSQTAAITATNQSPVSVPVISGTALQFGAESPVITVNAGLAATGLVISAPITQNAAMLSLTKSGAGVLALSGQSTFTTGLTLAAGALMLGVFLLRRRGRHARP
jgi:autotransporter-associated beta strand protein